MNVAQPSSRSSDRHRWLSGWCFVLGSVWVLFTAPMAWSQPLGTLPSTEAIGVAPAAEGATSKPASQSPGVAPKMFLVLDDAGNQIAVTGMTFEKLDELLKLRDGWLQTERPYSIESLEVRGKVLSTSAELTVTVRIELEPTGGKWVSVPLRMDNFHRTGPPDISGIERYRMDLSGEGGGHVLHLESDVARSVVVVMRVVARVTQPPTSAIEFRLPDAPSLVVLNIPSTGISADVIGQGDEVLSTRSGSGETEVSLSGRGGTFGLRFGSRIPQVDTRPMLDSESRIVVDWQQADNTPLVSHEITVRSLRGDLGRFELALPGGASLLQQPMIRGGGPFEVGEPIEPETIGGSGVDGEPLPTAEDGTRVGVIPTEGRGDSRVEIGVATQLRTLDERPGARVLVRGVLIEDAVEQTGEIEIRVPRDYRLRWESQPWVSSLWDQAETESLSTRGYRFRFERMPFELPIWLSARTQRLRIEGDYRLTFYDTSAVLRVQLRTTGGVPDSRILPIEIGSWQVQSVSAGGTATAVETDRTAGMLEIDLSALPGGGENDRMEIVLVQPITDDQERIDLTLPRIVGDPALIGAITSALSVITEADYRFVADLASSRGLGEVLRVHGPLPAPDPLLGLGLADEGIRIGADLLGGLGEGGRPIGTRPIESAHENRYALPDISAPVRLTGFLVTERPGVSFQAEAELSIQGNQLVEVIHWTLYPRSRLRGRLPILWDEETAERVAVATATEDGPGVRDTAGLTGRLATLPLWSVTVDDTPAVLRASPGGEYVILSEALSSGPHRVRLRRAREIPEELWGLGGEEFSYQLSGVVMPRPGVSDLSLLGPMPLRLRAEQGLELTSRDGQSRWSDDISLPSVPTGELSIRLRRVEGEVDDITIRRAWLQTAVSRDWQYDQLVATVQGGGLMRLPLVGGSQGARVRADVNGSAVDVTRESDDVCLVRLGESGTHSVVVQLYQPRAAALFSERIRPLLGIPAGAERVFWEVVTPQDDHLVWHTPTVGAAMNWQFDRWHLRRQPLQSVGDLAAWAAGGPIETRVPQGNRYLFVGVDATGLRAVTLSRLAIWMIVGTSVLTVSCLLTYFPVMRHPLFAVTAAVLLGGLTFLLPDAAVLVGQVMLVAMLLVGVIAGVGHVLVPRRPTRVLVPGVEHSSLRSKTPGRPTSPQGSVKSATGPSATVPAMMPPRGSTAEVR